VFVNRRLRRMSAACAWSERPCCRLHFKFNNVRVDESSGVAAMTSKTWAKIQNRSKRGLLLYGPHSVELREQLRVWGRRDQATRQGASQTYGAHDTSPARA
jgi:hypothetical protein